MAPVQAAGTSPVEADLRGRSTKNDSQNNGLLVFVLCDEAPLLLVRLWSDVVYLQGFDKQTRI